MKANKIKQFGFGIALCAFAANTFAASPIWVFNTNDAGNHSLRAAITKANNAGGGEIGFCVKGTIKLESPLPSLTNITITGPGANILAISGNYQSQVFCMNQGSTNILSGLSIADGTLINTSSEGVVMGGAGISNAGSLKLVNCVIQDCVILPQYVTGGGIYNVGYLSMTHCEVVDCGQPYGLSSGPGGGIANRGDMRMDDCTVSGCLAYYGGGIWNTANLFMTNCIVESCLAEAAADGGGIYSDGNLTIHSCTISNCGAFWGGGIESWGNFAMTNSSIVDNGADFGSGLFLSGTNVMLGCTITRSWFGNGGILNYGGILSLFNCTVSGDASGIQNGTFWGTNATICMNHCTVAINTNRSYLQCGVANGGIFYAQNSIFEGNATNVFSSALISGGYNLIQNTNGFTITGNETGNIYGADPLLGPLQNNGGPTWTHALLLGSPAIDAGSSADTLAFDQRGIHRPQGLAPDIGAFEFEYTTPVLARMAIEASTNCCLKLCGLSGGNYTLQTSTNLVDWSNVATSIADTNGVCDFTVRGAGACSRRFYRPLAQGY